jgi:hypothetical protein
MTPAENNQRHCASCAKNVVDFSSMSTDEILHFFQANTGSVCGRLRQDQLNQEFVKPVTYTQPANWWKRVALLPLLLLSKEMLAQARYVNTRAREKNTAVQIDSLPQTVANDTVSQPDYTQLAQLDTLRIPLDSLHVDRNYIRLAIDEIWSLRYPPFAFDTSCFRIVFPVVPTTETIVCKPLIFHGTEEMIIGAIPIGYREIVAMGVINNSLPPPPPPPWYSRPFDFRFDTLTSPNIKAVLGSLPILSQLAMLPKRFRIRRRKR